MLSLTTLIFAGILALLLGAFLAFFLKNHGWGIAALKGVTASFLGGLLLVHLLPEAYARSGSASLFFMGIGFFIMVLIEKLAAKTEKNNRDQRFFTAELIWIGLFLHQFTDGAGLAMASGNLASDWQLALVVITHRIPVAAVVVWLFDKTGQLRQAWLRLAAMAVATILGATFANALAPWFSAEALNWFYAFIAGAFLHLLTHDFLDHHAHGRLDKKAEFIAFFAGALILVLTLWSFPQYEDAAAHGDSVAATGEHHMFHPHFQAFIEAFLVLIKETAPYLLLGLLVSGLLHAYLPASPINWLRRGRPLTQSLKGMAFGLPLPICSCGVLPLFLSLAKKGLGPAGLVAFLIATPELGVDSFLLSAKLLGWNFTLVRLVVAVILPILISLLAVRLFLPKEPLLPKPAASCCSQNGQDTKKAWWRFAFIDLVDDIFPFVCFGLLIAALAQTLWPTAQFGQWVGRWDVLLLGLVGIPFYVCASASIPFALVLLQHGFSIGAVVVFLFAGPATNVATILTVDRAFGPRSGLKLAATALVTAVGLGFAINLLYRPETLGVLELHDHGQWAALDFATVGALLALALASLYRSGPLHWISELVGMIPGLVHHPARQEGQGHH